MNSLFDYDQVKPEPSGAPLSVLRTGYLLAEFGGGTIRPREIAIDQLTDDARPRRYAHLAHDKSNELLDRVRADAHALSCPFGCQPTNQMRNRFTLSRAQMKPTSDFQ